MRKRAFESVRPAYDLFLAQHARFAEGFDREAYIRDLANLGFTHVEVNGLAGEPIEEGVPGEVYPRFYTYGPALDQFVSSRLNRGIYAPRTLKANLKRLKENAALALKYGMKPGLLCYEPRNVPDALLRKYPMLRGPRVDHPMRSFKPRFSLTPAQPAVREHYAELMGNLLREVPQLDYLTIWTNDSGAGFEYTNSLYVGRNGGGYVIREWKDGPSIAEAAANNLVRFIRLLRDAARKVNPKFRVLLRFEPFETEWPFIEPQLGEGLDVETSSLLSRGWELQYRHPKYPEVPQVHTTALHNRFSIRERAAIRRLERKGTRTDVLLAPGVLWNHEPLIGIPFPFLVHEKLSDLFKAGVRNLSVLGGATPSKYAPFNVNQEVLRGFLADPKLNLKTHLAALARQWVGERRAKDLVAAWRGTDEAFRSFPVPVWIYSGWGVWYRLLHRPIVPDIEAIPEKDRAYYERYLLATAHNPNRIDLRWDVGFDLCEPERALKAVRHMDRDLFPTLERARASAHRLEDTECGRDLSDRLAALRCWFRTQRNVAAWIAGVHGTFTSARRLLRDMVFDEIENTRELLRLTESSRTKWLITAAHETTFVYGRNFADGLRRKIKLMTGRENDAPRIDPDFVWRKSVDEGLIRGHNPLSP